MAQNNRKLQVFISSTYTDLLSERQAAVSAILKAGHIPAGMELFTAGDKSQMEIIKRWIDESDVYLLILGGRYGSVEPTSGISYTELEYDYAREQRKPTFSVVINAEFLEAKVKTIGSSVMETVNPKALKLFREKVLSNMSAFFSDDKDIRLAIYESLSDFAVDANLKGWVAGEIVSDIGVLRDEISELKEERDQLIQKLERAEKLQSLKSKDRNREFIDLSDVLKAITINIPKEIHSKGVEENIDLLEFMILNSELLINGITNRVNMSKADELLYYNVMPKLQMYGLADNERIPGAMYRRSYLNKKGQTLVAEIQKERILGNKMSKK